MTDTARVTIPVAEEIAVQHSDQVQVQGDVVRVNGESIPTDKWRAGLWLVGKVAKGGPTAMVLLVLVGWYLYDGAETKQREANRSDKRDLILSRLAENQATMIKSVDQKNETISSNHDMLISSRDRDERMIRLLTEIGDQLKHASEVMANVPADRKEERRILQEHTQLLEKMLEGINRLKSSYLQNERRTDGGETKDQSKPVRGGDYGPLGAGS